jgi:hypothetical protein
MNEVDRAELIQSVKAFAIPASLFLSCVILAGGVFLIYNGYNLGWAFAAISATIQITAFTAFIRFQNKLRVAGRIPEDKPIANASAEK